MLSVVKCGLLLVLYACSQAQVQSASDAACQAEVVVALDISRSTTQHVWENKVLIFLRELVTRLDISLDAVRIALLSFNDTEYAFHDNGAMILSESESANDVSSHLANIYYHKGPTCVDCALRAIRENFHNNLGDRPGVSNYAVVVTDGVPTVRKQFVEEEANANHDAGIHTFALALQGENYPDMKTLEMITGSVDNIFPSSTEDELLASAEAIAREICPGGGPDLCKNNPCENGGTCEQTSEFVFECICPVGFAGIFCESECPKVDLAFILDASASIKGTRWREIVIPFVRDFVDYLHIGESDSHVASASFSNVSHLNFNFLSVIQNRDEIHRNIDEMVYIKDSTCIACGLREATNSIFGVNNGDRPGVPNVAVLFSDGKANQQEALTMTEADRLKTEGGVRVFSIGVSGNVNETELRQIVTQPHEDHYMKVNSFDELLESSQMLTGMMCKNTFSESVKTYSLIKRSVPEEKLMPSRHGRGFMRSLSFSNGKFGH